MKNIFTKSAIQYRTLFPIIAIVIIYSVILSCGRKSVEQPQEKILARIGEKTISVNEFIRRAEYTIRPQYCNGDNYIHKKIILNSLIAEKLLALEAGTENELFQNEQFQDYIRGRKEQAMRQWLYYNDFYNKVGFDTTEIKNEYALSNRKYRIAYYSIKDSSIVKLVDDKFRRGRSFTEVFHDMGGLDSIPERSVSWESPEHATIQNALYSTPLTKGQVLGPLKIETNFYTVMKILGWTKQVLITDTQVRDRWNDVVDKLKDKKATAEYRKYISDLMRGKRVDFEENTFYSLVNILGPMYMVSDKDKENAFNQRFWHNDKEQIVLDNLRYITQNIADQQLLKIENQVWTVRDFERELNAHPLVFRKRRMKRSEFAEQLKLAIVDMIRDKYITKDANKKGYGQAIVVERNQTMWKDNLVALFERNQFLESIGKNKDFKNNYLPIINSWLNPYIESLQKKYSDVIEINTDIFEEIILTKIDLFVLQRNVPFPIIIPSFPVITTINRLDYGEIMENNK